MSYRNYNSSEEQEWDDMDKYVFNPLPSYEYIQQSNQFVPKKRYTDPKIIVGIAILVAVFLIMLIVKRHQLTEIDEDEEEL